MNTSSRLLALSVLLAPATLRAAEPLSPAEFFGALGGVLGQVVEAQKEAVKKPKDEWWKPLKEREAALQELHAHVDPSVLQIERGSGKGTGFIVDASGVMMTCAHVIGDAKEVTVQSDSVSARKAKVVAVAPERDIAILQIEGERKDWPALPFGDASAIRRADMVVAYGNALGMGIGMNSGQVQRCDSAVSNAYANCIQTSTSIQPGDSGGPVVNIKGEVVGMNQSIPAQGRDVSFSVKSDVLQAALAQYRKDGELADYGIEASYQLIRDDDGKGVGLWVAGAPQGSALRRFDVIAAIDGAALPKQDPFGAFKKALAKKGKGDKVALSVIHQEPQRDGSMKQTPEELEVPLQKLPKRQSAAAPPPILRFR
ncbi:MAG TPA: trypsin-like peptidase domain-containing protein [Elusimicrobiota bacterium]|jgi:serine protease Do|nr:trypsin-like peptidase domain-containing protein [Elusimicrobiota bacterium]